MDKISVNEFLNNSDLLEITYTPFYTKLQIVTKILNSVINATGEINTSIIRRISTQVFIENITNIDMSIKDENDLDGYDKLCYLNKLSDLKKLIGLEYIEFENILNERLMDYIRIETNPTYAVSEIYKMASNNTDALSTLLLDKSKDVEIDELVSQIGEINSEGTDE